jgi:hypothetical protein
MSRQSSAEEMGEWVVDPNVVQGGRTQWVERERVVLVLGGKSSSKLQGYVAETMQRYPPEGSNR